MKNAPPRRIWEFAAAHLVTDIYSPVIPAVLPLLIANNGYSYLLAGLLVTVYNLTSSMTQPFIGWLFDRRGRGIHVSYALLLSGVFIGLIGVVTSYPLLVACAMLAALGHAAFHPSALGSVGGLCTDENRGRTMSFFVTGGNLGYALGPLLAGIVVAAFGIHGLVVMMLPALAMAAVLRYAYPLDRGVCIPKVADDNRPGMDRAAILSIGILVLGAAFRAWAIFASIAYLPAYLVGRGYDLAPANFLISLMLLSGVAGQIAGGILSDRYGRKEVTILGMLGAIPAFILFMLTEGMLSLSILMIFGFLLWSSFSITVAIAQELMPRSIGLASGLTLGLAVGGGGIGVAITGALADSFALDIALLTLAVPVAVSILLFMVLPYPWRLVPRRRALD